ncbi:hypothetical protein FSW04_16765 [Baekduia soli]|uniref:Uncharacterized protein n=1 Tax=Baekduia soli TaxID=496014 RepID=A0A5B8U7I4_9ACTN|nr:hypothetical protein [Baekduia soli]QEC49063.1 hypothetical protein FSW04_16765 [Baekduia soli]
MHQRTRIAVVLALLLLVVAVPLARSRAHDVRAAAQGDGRVIGRVSAAERAQGLTFAPDVGPYDRQAISAAIADAGPQARRLIGIVDGLVDLEVADPGAGTVGLTQSEGARFKVTLDLAKAARAGGRRAIDRLVLHELGHVVRFALVPVAVRDQLVAQVPRGFGCDDGVSGACAQPEEIFAESFAKWATGDIGVNLNLGYAVPPPTDLAAWGVPLERLGG